MEFRCDRCATRYSTTQAVSERRAYKYTCRLCGHTIFVRTLAPPEPPPSIRPIIVHDVGRIGGVPAPARARVEPEPERVARPRNGPGAGAGTQTISAPPPRDRAPERLPADLFSGKSVIDPADLPKPRDGYIDLTLDDDPPPARVEAGSASAGAVTLPALTPVPARRTAPPATPLPRPRAAFRPADGPNRAARGDLTPTAPIPLARRQRGLEALLGKVWRSGPRPPLKVTRRQRLLVAAAVFPVVTATAVALGVAFAGGPEATEPRKRPPVGAVAASAQVPPPFTPGPPGPAPRVSEATPLPPPPRPLAAASAASLPRPARAEQPRVAAARPVRPEPPPARSEPRTAREPERPPPAARVPRVASAPSFRRQEQARDAMVPTLAGAAPVRPPERHASAPRAEREEEPIVPRPGHRPPAPLTPGCVEQHIRLPASWSDRLPGSVILRFAVGRSGTPDLVQMQPGPDRLAGERVEPEIGQALGRAVRSCRFSPGVDDLGRPVRMWVVMKVQFAP